VSEPLRCRPSRLRAAGDGRRVRQAAEQPASPLDQWVSFWSSELSQILYPRVWTVSTAL
jgi:hypothetical protein